MSASPRELRAAKRIVLPGVGAFGDCRGGLSAREGLFEAIEDLVIAKGRPFLGICVGMQLMADRGEEYGSHAGFGWIGGCVEPIRPQNSELKIPHMGWNEIAFDRSHPVFDGFAGGEHMYFVHSFHLRVKKPNHRVAHADHGGAVTACVARDNLIGVQFHPEKSADNGLRFIENFLAWTP